MLEHWRADCQFDINGDDFYCQWVQELCLWIDGNATASQMHTLTELISEPCTYCALNEENKDRDYIMPEQCTACHEYCNWESKKEIIDE